MKIYYFLILTLISSNVKSQKTYNKIGLDKDISMLICYGQSLSVGGHATNGGSKFPNILSFQGGCNEWSSKVDLTDSNSVHSFYGDKLVPLDSLKNKSWPPVVTAANSWMKLLKEENGVDISLMNQRFLLSTPGFSGVQIEKLSKDTELYKRLLYGVKKGNEFAKKDNKTFGVPVVFWVQGESNITDTKDEYLAKLELLFTDLNNDIKLITKQKKDVVFITYQTAPVIGVTQAPSAEKSKKHYDSGPSFAQLEIAESGKNIYMGGAMYQYEYGDIWHPVDRAVVGIQLGIIAKRIISDNVKLKSFTPSSYKIKTKKSEWVLHVKFDVPTSPMRFDTTGGTYHNLNGKQLNYGFTLLDKDGKNLILKEPYIIDGNTLVIHCNKNPKDGILNYALNGHYGGGNLCDSQNITILNKDKNYMIDNFCPAFRNYSIK